VFVANLIVTNMFVTIGSMTLRNGIASALVAEPSEEA
jgi:hypothetical protein